MGLFGRAAGKLRDLAWRPFRARAGIVLDSRRPDVRWVADDASYTMTVVAADFPVTVVRFDVSPVTASVGGRDVPLRLGTRGIRRATFDGFADWDGAAFRLRQRGRRLAELQRDGDTIAVLARPRKGARSINWGDAAIAPEQAALGHALAVYAEIGAPGAVANILSNISP